MSIGPKSNKSLDLSVIAEEKSVIAPVSASREARDSALGGRYQWDRG